MSKYQLLINGEMVDGDLTMDVLNPATEEKVADCPRASVEQLNSAVEAAKDAFPSWSQTSVDERKGCLLYTSPSPRDPTKSRMPSSA